MTEQLKQAAQQALQCLRYLKDQSDCDVDPFRWMQSKGNAAIEALNTALTTSQPAQAGEREAWVPYLVDRADGVKGHYAIGRWNPRGYREVWNLHSHQWAAYSDDVMSLEEADSLLRQITIPTVRASLPTQPAQATREAREADQRARMQARLAARHDGKATADFDLPAPNDDIHPATQQAAGEPVVWIQPDHLQKARVAPHLCRVAPTRIAPDFVPMFTHPAPGVPEGWQPIQTAPTDGTKFLGWRRGRVATAYRVQRDDCEMWSFGGESGAFEHWPETRPEFWMPHPPEPALAAAQAKGGEQ